MEINFYNRFRGMLLPIFAFAVISFIPMSPQPAEFIPDEICDNAIDDDADGLIDLNDPDCDCIVIEPVSLIPNPSFEDTNCCPGMQSELACAAGWIQASFPTTDFIHTCGWLGWDNDVDQFPPPQPFPDGAGIVGFRDGVIFPPGNGPDPMAYSEPNWKEYAGACLLSPMKADSFYRMEFDIGFVNPQVSPPIMVTLFGTSDCALLPFGENDVEALTGCPTNTEGWVELGFVPISGGDGNQWINTAIEVVPDEDILAIAIGPNCSNNLRDQNHYYFLDNLLLDEIESFQINIATVSHPCAEDFSLQIEDNPDFSYQWYKDGIALIGETSAQLSQMYGEGNYQVRADDGTDCILSGIRPFTIPVLINTVQQSICEGETFLFGDQELSEGGIYLDTLASANACDSVTVLDLVIGNALLDTVNAMIFEGEIFEIGTYSFSQAGDYSITVTSPDGCEVLTYLHLEFHKVFIPNAFSPNQDGINDTFAVLAENGLIQNVDITIFNRWGGTIYNGPKWDGRVNNEFVDPGVYVYLIQVTLNDNTSHRLSGSVNVLH